MPEEQKSHTLSLDTEPFAWLSRHDSLLTPREAAKILQIPVKRVYSLGLSRVAVLPKRGTRFDPRDLALWLRTRRTSEAA